ncbi:MAG: gliding motility-associated C-terminal domain-containing protein [Flavobacteriales bacterium]|nr:gliding motility-associated C-terminal domain-containing protein [Flavobacteriales bacterium]
MTSPSCAGVDDGVITVISLSGGPYEYSINGAPPVPDQSFTGLTAGPYTIVVADAAQPCLSVIDTLLIEPDLVIIGNPEYCPADPPVLTVLPIGGFEPLDYLWSDGTIGETLTVPLGDEGTYTVSAADANGCVVDAEIEVVALPGPVAVMGIPDTVCQRVLVPVFTLSNTGNAQLWEWGTDGTSTETLHQIVFTQSGWQPISIQALDTITGCANIPVLDSIFVEAQVPAIFTAEHVPCTPFVDVLLGSTADSCALFVNGTLLTEQCNGFLRYDARRYEEQVFTLYATQANGCNDTLEITVDVRTEPTLFLSNAFSPDGDAINELWPANVEISDLGYELAVYDRWGRQLWISNDPTDQWDGTANGSPVPVGVYVYTMRYRDPCQATDEVTSNGFLTIVR